MIRSSRFCIRTVLLLGCLLTVASCVDADAKGDPPQFAEPSNLIDLRAGYALDDAAEQMLRNNGFVVLDVVSAPDLHAAYPKHPVARYLFVTTNTFAKPDGCVSAESGADAVSLRQQDRSMPPFPILRHSRTLDECSRTGRSAPQADRK